MWLPSINYYNKIGHTADFVETSHLVDVPDDDIVLISFLNEATFEINKKPDINLVMGQVARFSGEFPRKINLQFEKQRHYVETSMETIQNLRSFFSNFFALNHAVCQRELYKKVSLFMTANPKLKPIRFFDKIFAFLCICEEKILVSKTLIQLRRDEDRMINTLKNYPIELEKNVDSEAICERLKDQNPFIQIMKAKQPSIQRNNDNIILELFKNIRFFDEKPQDMNHYIRDCEAQLLGENLYFKIKGSTKDIL